MDSLEEGAHNGCTPERHGLVDGQPYDEDAGDPPDHHEDDDCNDSLDGQPGQADHHLEDLIGRDRAVHVKEGAVLHRTEGWLGG